MTWKRSVVRIYYSPPFNACPKSAGLADFSLFCEYSASSRLKPEALARSSCPFVQGGVPWRRYGQKYEQSSALLDRRTFRHLMFQVANSLAQSSARANGKKHPRVHIRAGDETLLLCRFFAILHEAASLYTIKPARWSIVPVVPLEIELDVWMCPETWTGCISPEVIRIAFHGAVYPAYRTDTSSILCG